MLINIKNRIKVILLSLLISLNFSLPSQAEPRLKNIQLPADLKIELFASLATKNGHLLANARFITFDNAGVMYVSSAKGNRILQVLDRNQDGIADDVLIVAENLNAPQGMQFLGESLLVANQDGVVKLDKVNGHWPAKVTPFINNLAHGWHTLKTIKLGPDNHLYINVGSSCNVCVESDPSRATILRYTSEGKPAGALLTLGRHQQSAIWARGLRNSQGFVWHPFTQAMYATNNGSDMRASSKNGAVNDELPPEHINKIEAGRHYGWPHCWGDASLKAGQFEDPNFTAEASFCSTVEAPAMLLQAHTTPIGITFLHNSNLPSAHKNDAIIALHGSWNRKEPAGYKLVRLKFNAQHQPYAVEDFATGWLQGREAWGRPVDVAVGTNGVLYVSDDKIGAIYRILEKP
jgi:glucose/arabinose dehydrogenase